MKNAPVRRLFTVGMLVAVFAGYGHHGCWNAPAEGLDMLFAAA